MKQTKMLVVIAMALLFSLPMLHAQSISHTVRANVPFQFTVAGRTLGPGEYLITTDREKVVTFKGIDNEEFTVALSNAINSLDPVSPKLVFHRNGDSYSLAQVWMGYSDVGREFYAPSKKTVKISRSKPDQVVMAIGVK